MEREKGKVAVGRPHWHEALCFISVKWAWAWPLFLCPRGWSIFTMRVKGVDACEGTADLNEWAEQKTININNSKGCTFDEERSASSLSSPTVDQSTFSFPLMTRQLTICFSLFLAYPVFFLNTFLIDRYPPEQKISFSCRLFFFFSPYH